MVGTVSGAITLVGVLALRVVAVVVCAVVGGAVGGALFVIAHIFGVETVLIGVVGDRLGAVVRVHVVIVVEAIVVVVVYVHVDVDVAVGVVGRAVVMITTTPAGIVGGVIWRRVIGTVSVVDAAIAPSGVVVIVAADGRADGNA